METPPPIRACGAPKATDSEYIIVQKYDEPSRLDFQVIRFEIARLEKEISISPSGSKQAALRRYRESLSNMQAIKQAYYRVSISEPLPNTTSCCYYGC
jgi:hypothetical protein